MLKMLVALGAALTCNLLLMFLFLGAMGFTWEGLETLREWLIEKRTGGGGGGP
jgi:UPF0716 family protein affecting phage T7 exclusion